MAALIALQLRICWRALTQVMRVMWVFVLILLLSYFSKKSSGSESLYALLGLPLVLIPLGALLAIGSADPLIWQVPMRRSARVWARVVLLSLSGAVVWTTQRVEEIRGFADHVTLLTGGRVAFQCQISALTSDRRPRSSGRGRGVVMQTRCAI